MAFTKSNEILTRISLKYDEYSNWTSKNPLLLKGEVAIATIEAGSTTTPAMQNLPNVVMKVGDGTSKYNALPFVSALAADVYSWAKAATKPSYAVSEISGALEYRLVTVDATNHKYALQARKAGSAAEWSNVADSAIDLSGLVSRVTTIESDLNTAKTGLKARVTQAETDIDNLQKAIGSGGSVSQAITAAVQALDSSASQTAGDDGLALSVTLVDGLVTDISGSIAANTYDAHGSAAAVKKELTEGAIKTNADAIDVIEGSDAGKSMRQVATAVIEGLDSTKGQTAASGNGQLALSITQANGVITAISGSIKANTYDAYGAAAAVQGDTTHTVADAYALADAAQTADEVAAAVKVEENARKAAIEALDYTGVEGTQSGTTIKFVDKISQANGIVSAELGELKLQSAYVPEAGETQNLIATMKDVTAAVADLNGAMHFEGVYDDMPSKNHDGEAFKAGDVIIVGKTEYVFSGGKFVELGDEGAIAAAINALDANVSQTAAANNGQLALNIVQDNGVIKSISGSIAANTYDAYGAAAGVKKELTNGGIKTNADAIATINGSDAGKSMRQVATAVVEGLDATQSQLASSDGLALSITQTNGVITAISGSIAADTYDAHGAAAGVKTALENGIIKTHTGKLETIQGNDTTKSMRTVAAEEATKAVQALDKTNAAQSGKYISAITQTDGLVTATYADLPEIPEIPDVKVTHAKSATAPAENEVVVVGDISASGHTITDTHVKVATMAGVTSAINALDNSDAAVDGEFVTVAKQTNGVVNVSRAKVNIKHLAQDANTYVVFNCGSASEVI